VVVTDETTRSGGSSERVGPEPFTDITAWERISCGIVLMGTF